MGQRGGFVLVHEILDGFFEGFGEFFGAKFFFGVAADGNGLAEGNDRAAGGADLSRAEVQDVFFEFVQGLGESFEGGLLGEIIAGVTKKLGDKKEVVEFGGREGGLAFFFGEVFQSFDGILAQGLDAFGEVGMVRFDLVSLFQVLQDGIGKRGDSFGKRALLRVTEILQLFEGDGSLGEAIDPFGEGKVGSGAPVDMFF